MARYVLMYIAAVAAVGCGKLREGVVREIEFPEHEPSLAVTAILTEGAPELPISVFRSAGILDSAGSQPAADAVVTVEGGGASFTWNGSAGFLELQQDSGWQWTSGAEVVLAGEAPELPAVSARAVVPPHPEAEATETLGADTTSTPWIGDPQVVDRVTFSLTNHPGVHDTYIVLLEQLEFGETWAPMWGDPDLATAERMEFGWVTGGYFIDDLGFDETPLDGFVFERIRWDLEEDPLPRRVRVQAVSAELFKHYQSLEAYFAALDNPFAEPASVYGNVDGGFGVLGLVREEVFVFE